MSQMRQVEEQLRDMILGLELGPGERLTERWIEAQFSASRTPIRAALLRLEAEGLSGGKGAGGPFRRSILMRSSRLASIVKFWKLLLCSSHVSLKIVAAWMRLWPCLIVATRKRRERNGIALVWIFTSNLRGFRATNF